MTTIQTVVLIGHTIIALLIIVLVLLQRGKGADAGAAFGAGASGTVFGAQGSSNFFSRATAIMATVFFASSLALAYMSSQRSTSIDSVLENAAPIEISTEQESVSDPVEDAESLLPSLEGAESALEDGLDGVEAAGELPQLEPASEETEETVPE